MPTFTAPSRLLGAACAALTLAAAALALPSPAAAAEPLPLVVTPSPVDFPATTVNEQSNVEVDVFNEGEEATIEKIAIEGGDASEFGIQNNGCGPLPEGGHCTVTFRFGPTGSGEKHSTAWIRFNGGRAEESFELEGTGAPPHLSFSPPSFDFGLREVHSGSSETSFTVENDGEAPTRVNSFFLEGDTNDFGIGNNDCGGRLLQPGETCFIRVSFFPSEVGALAVTLRVDSNGASFTAAVSGESARPEVEVTPNPVDLGAAAVGTAGTTRTVTLTNVGRIPVGFFIAVISGGDPASFQLLEESCTGAQLQTGDSCAAEVRFAPISAGPKAARLSMFGNGEGGTQIPLLGEGVAPAVSLTPSSFDFGGQAVGGRSEAHAFTVRNDGSDPLRLDAASIVGPDLDQFALSSDTCTGATLGAGAQCLVKVRFAPDASGAKAATLRVSGDAGPLTASLSGTGTVAPPPPARVELHWREVSARLHGGSALRAGSAKCSSAKRCKVTLTAKLSVVRHPRRGPTETRVANLPRTQLKIGSGKSKKLDVRLPASARKLLDHGRATLSLKAKWTADGQAGKGSHTSKLH
jgi:Abnormal spindle-like microcephaly-assoc'd, ASPM-SPD-2-Hydin